MNPRDLLLGLRRHGMKVSQEEGLVRVENSGPPLTPAIQRAIRSSKEGILARLCAEDIALRELQSLNYEICEVADGLDRKELQETALTEIHHRGVAALESFRGEFGWWPTSVDLLGSGRGTPKVAMNALTWALGYAAKGLKVFPIHSWSGTGCTCGKGEGCKNPAKHPRTPHGFKDATDVAAKVRAWWARWPDANIGIATGSESGVVVLDIDPRHGGDESFAALEGRLGALSRTLVSKSGGGGRHLWFKNNDKVSVRNSQGVLGQGLDVRADGGYILAPPSTHSSGGVYQWVKGCRVPAPLPDTLLQILMAPPRTSSVRGLGQLSIPRLPTGGRSTAHGRRMLQKAIDGLPGASEKPRHDRILAASARMGRWVALGDLDADEARTALTEQGLSMGKSFEEVTRAVRDGLLFGVRRTLAEYPPCAIEEPAPGVVLRLPGRIPLHIRAILTGTETCVDPDREVFGVCRALARAGMGTKYITRAIPDWSPLSRAVAARGEAGGVWLRHTIASAKRVVARRPERAAEVPRRRMGCGSGVESSQEVSGSGQEVARAS